MVDKKLVLQIQQALSKDPKIILAYVLGSVVSGQTKKGSDFDLAVVVDRATEFKSVYNLVSKIHFPRDLDLSVVDKKSSPIFLFQIISTGECIYSASDRDKISFETFIAKNYYDSAHLRKIYYSYLKDKFPYANQ